MSGIGEAGPCWPTAYAKESRRLLRDIRPQQPNPAHSVGGVAVGGTVVA